MALLRRLLTYILAGWINRHKQDASDYLKTEHQVLKEKLGNRSSAEKFDPTPFPTANALLKVILRVYKAGNRVCFEVEDNGIGLSRRAAKRVFDSFYQVDQTLSRTNEGCELGLSIVEFIVKAHRGSVSIASEQGKGSTFTVRLPAE